MFYWLIPYFVAYNASYSSDWIDEVEHVFETHVVLDERYHDHRSAHHSRKVINFVCKRLYFNLMQCRIDSTRAESDSTSDVNEECGLDGTVFQIEYNAVGISKVWFLNNNSTVYHDMIRAIIGTMNIGMNIRAKTMGDYISQEKSIIGTCTTTFTIRNAFPLEAEAVEDIKIEGYDFLLPSSGLQTKDKIIVIEKSRDLTKCIKKTPYFYGDWRETLRNSKVYLESSESQLHIGKRSFSAYTLSTRADLSFPGYKFASTGGKVQSEWIHVSLKSIRPTKKEYWITKGLVRAGAGLGPGTLWPGTNMEE